MNHWLVKTEPGEFSLGDLEREGRTVWSGVGSPLARRYLRAMRAGDLVLVYHTGREKQIVGIATVIRAGEEPELGYQGRLPQPVSLPEVKSHKEFAEWELVRLGRLSVMPVSAARWHLVLKIAANPQK